LHWHFAVFNLCVLSANTSFFFATTRKIPKLRHSHDAGNISLKPQKPVLTSLLRLLKRHASIYATIFAAGALLLVSTLPTFAQARCDTDKSCIGAALTLSQSAQAQYVDIRKTASQNTLTTALTFEAWLNPTRQAGVRQFVAGLWGPNTDQNDVWVVYISAQDELVFEVNGVATSLGAMDNTIARTSIANRYNTWFHVAAIFDGTTQTARLLIGGVEVAQNRNAAQPASVLRVPQGVQGASLLMQIGNTNALNNINEQNATYRGQMDEIRLWSRALTQSEVFCGLTSSLEGNTAFANERGLVLYYRCNEVANAVTLCDATNNGNTGDLRSGARCLAPTQNRTIPQVLAATPTAFTESFLCDQTRTYSIQIRNASPSCSEQVNISLAGQDASQFTISPQRFTLAAGASTQATVRLAVATRSKSRFASSARRSCSHRCGL
jgi:Concanavalin A-like lectin/glucanases superfamily